MDPIDFKTRNVLLGKDQEEYETLPAHYDELEGVFTTYFKLSPQELLEIQKNGGVIEFKQLSFGRTFHPIMLQVPTAEAVNLIL